MSYAILSVCPWIGGYRKNGIPPCPLGSDFDATDH